MGILQMGKKKRDEALKFLTQNKIKYQIMLSNKSLNNGGLLFALGLVEPKTEICLGGVRSLQYGSRI
jgi:hypothetical protein